MAFARWLRWTAGWLNGRKRAARKKARLLAPVRDEILAHRHAPVRGLVVVDQAWRSARGRLGQLDAGMASSLEEYYRAAKAAERAMKEGPARLSRDARSVQVFMRLRRANLIMLEHLMREAGDGARRRREETDLLAQAARAVRQRRPPEAPRGPEDEGRGFARQERYM